VGTDPRLYCATNGCATTLRLDAAGGVAACPICGYRRRIA
jgi:DNA-directed RNA polymerase subunit RPC12/RpoP